MKKKIMAFISLCNLLEKCNIIQDLTPKIASYSLTQEQIVSNLYQEIMQNNKFINFILRKNSKKNINLILTTAKPDLNDVRNEQGQTALHIASIFEQTEVVQMLLDYDPGLIDLTDNDGKTALYNATWNGNIKIIQMLLDKKPDSINIRTMTSISLLHIACYLGYVKVVQMFLDKKPDSKITNILGATALHLASINGHVKIVKMLLDYDLSLINITDKNGDTALHTASHFGHVQVIKILLAHNSNRNIRNIDGHTAQDIANKVSVRILRIILVSKNILVLALQIIPFIVIGSFFWKNILNPDIS